MGSGKGSLYGAGLYFADSIVKADEYSDADEDGVYSMLLCRVLGGNVLYSAEDVKDGQKPKSRMAATTAYPTKFGLNRS